MEMEKDVFAGTVEGIKIETLETSRLGLADGVEVVVSRVDIPANTMLPKHFHPGEEFIYLLGGSATMWVKGQGEMSLAKGEVFKVPLKAVHTLTSGPEGARVLVHRVHESGKPTRYVVDEDD